MRVGEDEQAFAPAPLEANERLGTLWRLPRALCGYRRAPRLKRGHAAGLLAGCGLSRLRSDGSLLYHAEIGAMLLCLVDGMVIPGQRVGVGNLGSR